MDVDAPPRRGRWATAAGAVTALALLGGLVVWTYRLGVRDPDDVPVIRAAAGSHKARPDDPGGATFDHQGRGVYAAMAGAVPKAAEVVMAPPPEGLAAEDASFAELQGAEGEEPIAPEGASEVDVLVAAALAEAAPVEPAVDASAAAVGVVEATAQAPLAAPIAPPRPGRAAAAATAPAGALPVVPVAAAAPAAAPIPTAAAVQLGAYLTEDVARQMWASIARRNGDLLQGRSPAIAPIERDGRTLFGLRAVAFADAAEARAMCAALRGRGEDCFVTLPR
jgi:cell division septation protein DedD